MAMMKRVVVDKPGGFDALVVKSFPIPEPGPKEVLIGVRAASINFADCMVRMGLYPLARKHGYPLTPGVEVAGVVQAVGPEVTRFSAGDRVIGMGPFGGYASHRIVGEDYTFAIPGEVDFEQAAALPRVFLTAHYALHEQAHVRAGETVLIHSAAGGVGTSAVQLAKLAGARLIAVVGAGHKVDFVRSLGADEVIDKSSQDLWKEVERVAPNGVEVILDSAGGMTAQHGYDHLAIGGRLVVYGSVEVLSRTKAALNWVATARNLLAPPEFTPRKLMVDNRAVMGFIMGIVIRRPEVLARIWDALVPLIVEGKIRVPKVTTYALEQVAAAHEALQSGKTVGKLVLIPEVEA